MATASSSPSEDTDSSQQYESSTGSMSTGAKAGIGVAAAVAVMALLAFIVTLVLMRRRLSKFRQRLEALKAGGHHESAFEVRRYELGSGSRVHESDAKSGAVHEK